MEETVFKYRGFSVQHELHWEEILDKVDRTTTDLRGTYTQIGFLPRSISKRIPEPLEVFRYAWVDPDRSRTGDRQEIIIGVNWFFSGHDNKLTFEYTGTARRSPSGGEPGPVPMGYQLLTKKG